ncbi:hypothetical protein TPHA_0E02400 [Tetrapisispora phaffii CBS 4417]|uniref:NADH-cytochrome b5 reductase n=1 Tax=Tetrapisispora phaffii (strain ATCC 24235 / CBS 4417 / NBRC 1672 / NRRL Y-8282 / UCD 70-5) TaxID=1071381 RepID=G8BTV4_TETPH|nr:hypothetical protein TPHA_0E02400 [Tetrapisispora phaffii CBS 4417]CCE63332.1 hypothetical protein TPHA_0E02400 [Tetrapisispora phaffii CBS 4417]
MFARVLRTNPKYIPLTVGAAAILIGAAYNFAVSRNNFISNSSGKVLVGDGKWVDIPIAKIENLSSDTKKFTFKLPSEDDVLGTEYASAILAKFVTPKGSNVIRPYTPVSPVDTKGNFELVIKHYEGGKMTEHLFGLKENDTVAFKGPMLKWKWIPNGFKEVTLIGGGTGITPLFQLIRAICENPNDKTVVKLFYGSKSPSDILLKKDIDEFQKQFPNQLKVTYFVDKSEDKTDYKVGYISKDFVRENCSKPAKDSHVFICGPPGFMDALSGQKKSPTDQGEITGIFKELGYTNDDIYKF